MMCECPSCAGRPTYSESWRAETEARYVARLPGHVARAVYLGMVGEARGIPVETALRKAAWALISRATEGE